MSAPLFGLGVALTALGAALVFISFKFDGEGRSAAILFIGPVPLVLSGKNRWVLVGGAVVGLVLVSLLVSWLVG